MNSPTRTKASGQRYSQVNSRFWIGPTGRKLRRHGPNAQLVALYLLTGSGANMIGLYPLPLMTGAAETGLSFEEFERALNQCEEAGFSRYDHENEVVWVLRMANMQVSGHPLNNGDHRIKACAKLLAAVDYSPLAGEFFHCYGDMTQEPRFPD